MKHLDIILNCKELTDEASLAIAFSAVRGADGLSDLNRKTMTANDTPVSKPLFEEVCRTIAFQLRKFIIKCSNTEGEYTLVLGVQPGNEHKAAELVPGLIHTAAVALITALWQKVTSPAEADAARAFADDRLAAAATILDEPRPFSARRPLIPF